MWNWILINISFIYVAVFIFFPVLRDIILLASSGVENIRLLTLEKTHDDDNSDGIQI